MSEQVRHKSKALLSKGYGLAPYMVMSDKNISIGAKSLFCYLSSIAGAVINEEFGGRVSWPSRNRICSDLDISKDYFSKLLGELKSAGYIKVVQERMGKGTFKNNVYIIQDIVEPEAVDNSKEQQPCPTKIDTGLAGDSSNDQLRPCPTPPDTVPPDTVGQDTIITKDLPLPKENIKLKHNSSNGKSSPVDNLEIAATLEQEDQDQNLFVESKDSTTEILTNSNSMIKGKDKKKKRLPKAVKNLTTKEYSPEFEAFWKEYPRKQDKREAYNIYNQLMEHTDLHEYDFVSAARKYAYEMEIEGREKQHIKLAKTWLTQSLSEYVPGAEQLNEDDGSEGMSDEEFLRFLGYDIEEEEKEFEQFLEEKEEITHGR